MTDVKIKSFIETVHQLAELDNFSILVESVMELCLAAAYEVEKNEGDVESWIETRKREAQKIREDSRI